MKTTPAALIITFAALAAVPTLPTPAAATPGFVRIHGELWNGDALAIGDEYTATVTLYDRQRDGEALWMSPVEVIHPDERGRFHVDLDLFADPETRAILLTEADWYWSVTINGTPLEPRQRMPALPAAGTSIEALQANNARTLDGMTLPEILDRLEPGDGLAREGVGQLGVMACGNVGDALIWTGELWSCDRPWADGVITAVRPGIGLEGGADEGEAELRVVLGDNGVANSAARSDHEHPNAISEDRLSEQIDTHNQNTESVHGIADTVALATVTDLASLETSLRTTRLPDRSGVYGLTVDYNMNGVFRITCRGSPCSPDNPGYVVMPSSPGRIARFSVTQTHSVIDGRALDMDPQLQATFSTTAGVAWPDPRPFFIYAINTEGGIRFGLGARPNMQLLPVGYMIGGIGVPGRPAAEGGIFILAADGMEDADVQEGQATLRIGSLLMRKTADDSWMIDELDHRVGIDRYVNESTLFDFPKGQFGAEDGSHFWANGGTAPIFEQAAYQYAIDHLGYVTLHVDLERPIRGGEGADDDVHVAMPYRNAVVAALNTAGVTRFREGAGYRYAVFAWDSPPGHAYFTAVLGHNEHVKLGGFTGQASLRMTVTYRAFADQSR